MRLLPQRVRWFLWRRLAWYRRLDPIRFRVLPSPVVFSSRETFEDFADSLQRGQAE